MIIEAGAEVRHCAFIRGSAIVGKGAVVGNSTELKNCLLFDKVQVPHFNYVGRFDSGLQGPHGRGRDHVQRAERQKAGRKYTRRRATFETGLKKFGAMLGDDVEVGCNTVLNPGVVLGRGVWVYPGSLVRRRRAGACMW